MLTKQVLDQNRQTHKQTKCNKLCDNIVKVFAGNRRTDSAYRWDYANCSHVLSVMSVPPSPNGSTSSIISSEDSSSNPCGFPAVRPTQPQYSLLSQPSTSSSTSFGSSANKQIKVCRVCGDRAKSYHFGGISCDSCKAFFRRSVQNDAYRNFHCPYERHCDITINSRKSCQYCRFHKCLSIGMEKSWVMTEEERMQMLKSRIERRKQEEEVVCVKTQLQHSQVHETGSNYEPDLSLINTFLSEAETKLIENLVNTYMKCSKEISFNLKCDQFKPSRTDILNIFFIAIQQFALFTQRFESFACIPTQDKQVLLRGGVLELCFLKGAFSYDMKGKYWRYDDHSSGVIYSDQLGIMVTKTLLEKHMQFIKTIKRLHLDEPTFILLCLVVFLSSDRDGLTNSELVQREQEKYSILLKSYLNWRYGTQMSSVLYPKLLFKLTDLRELAEAHTDYHLLLGRQELQQIQQQLATLNIAILADNHLVDPSVCCDAKVETSSSAVSAPLEWTFRMSAKCSSNRSLYADEELSTSSEGSEKLSSD